jgi:disulfide bond formation protein DsbB
MPEFSLKQMTSVRSVNGLVALSAILLMAFALVLQHYVGLHPCPLCMTQRIFVVLVGFTAFIAFCHHPGVIGRRIYAGLGALLAVIGGVVAGRHIWIQNLPEDQVPACGPDLAYMFSNFPFQRALELLFMGDGNCHEVVWEFLGMSIPEWTLVWFAVYLFANGWQLFRKA